MHTPKARQYINNIPTCFSFQTLYPIPTVITPLVVRQHQTGITFKKKTKKHLLKQSNVKKNPFVNVRESAYGNLAQPRTHAYSLDNVSGENIKRYLGGYATLTVLNVLSKKFKEK